MDEQAWLIFNFAEFACSFYMCWFIMTRHTTSYWCSVAACAWYVTAMIGVVDSAGKGLEVGQPLDFLCFMASFLVTAGDSVLVIERLKRAAEESRGANNDAPTARHFFGRALEEAAYDLVLSLGLLMAHWCALQYVLLRRAPDQNSRDYLFSSVLFVALANILHDACHRIWRPVYFVFPNRR